MTTNLVLDPRQRAMLAEMGVRVWLPSDDQAVAIPVVPVSVRREPPLRLPVLSSPPPSPLDRTTSTYVIGNLPPQGHTFDYVLVGEPCTAEASKLLTNISKTLGSSVFVAQLIASQDAVTETSLNEQLATIKPKAVLAMGQHAAQTVLSHYFSDGNDPPIGKLRGSVHTASEFKLRVIVTYHADYLYRHPRIKAQAWSDLKLAMKVMK